jgi:hypothetical protein
METQRQHVRHSMLLGVAAHSHNWHHCHGRLQHCSCLWLQREGSSSAPHCWGLARACWVVGSLSADVGGQLDHLLWSE